MLLPPALVEATVRLVEAIPEQALMHLLPVLDRESITDWQAFKQDAQRSVPAQADLRTRVGTWMTIWHQVAPSLPPQQLLGALQLAAQTHYRAQQRQVLELVCTGPRSNLALRQTAQALKQLILEAQHRLLIVSFAVYDIPDIVAALAAALARGVQIRLIVETHSRQRTPPTDRLSVFGPHVRQQMTVYAWPLANRPRNAQGHHGLLHVKCAVADDQVLFLSSANLTQYALMLNIEMGILAHGGPLPQQVQQHFQSLIDQQILVSIPCAPAP